MRPARNEPPAQFRPHVPRTAGIDNPKPPVFTVDGARDLVRKHRRRRPGLVQRLVPVRSMFSCDSEKATSSWSRSSVVSSWVSQ